jgi:hypothetical protein
VARDSSEAALMISTGAQPNGAGAREVSDMCPCSLCMLLLLCCWEDVVCLFGRCTRVFGESYSILRGTQHQSVLVCVLLNAGPATPTAVLGPRSGRRSRSTGAPYLCCTSRIVVFALCGRLPMW